MRTLTLITTSLFLGFLSLPGFGQHTPDGFYDAVRRDTESLGAVSTRMTGTPENAEASQWLERELRELENVQIWTHEFPVWMPQVERATLTVDAGPMAGTHEVFPLWPDLVRLNTTGPEGIQGQVIYVGDGSMANLSARSLRGNIAAMEMSAYNNWKQPFAMNAAAVLLLGSPDDRQASPAAQAQYRPRYYIPDGDLANAIRAQGLSDAVVHSDMSWERVTARNLYALVPSAESGNGLSAVAMAAAYDAMSLVLGQAPGAENALDAAFLLNLARETAASPPPRSVLFAFVDANAMNQLGMRQFLTMLTVTESDTTRLEYVRVDTRLTEENDELVELMLEIGTGIEALEQIHNKRRFRGVQRAFKDVLSPEMLRLREDIAQLRLDIYAAERELAGAVDRADEQRQMEAGAEIDRLRALLEENTSRNAFLNRILQQVLTPAPITEEIVPEALQVLERAGARVVDQAASQRERMDAFVRTDEIRNEILAALGKEPGTSPVEFLVGVDLSDAGFTVGPGLFGGHLQQNAGTQARDFIRWLRQNLADENRSLWNNAPPGVPASTIDHASLVGTESPRSFNFSNTALLTSPAASFQMPAVTWKTLGGTRDRVDTPRDRVDQLDWERLHPQILASRQVLSHMVSDETFNPSTTGFTRGNPTWRRPWGSFVRESVGETVPRNPVSGALVTLVPTGSLNGTLHDAPGIRRYEFAMTRDDGGFTFPPMAGGLPAPVAQTHVYGFRLDEHGRITHGRADNTSSVQGHLSSGFNLNAWARHASPARLMEFEGRELNGPEFFDPRFLEPLSSFQLIDPMTGGRPRQGQFTVIDGQMWGLLPPDSRWQMILRAGTASNRMILMNLDRELAVNPDMQPQQALRRGFELGEPLPSTPAHVSARDFHTINSWRLQTFQSAGITSKVLNDIHAEAETMLTKADAALETGAGDQVELYAIQALSNAFRVYEALLATGKDVTRGAIFLMILIVPFSVAMERLLFSCVKIGSRIQISFGIFLGMSLMLWSFHPAFRITNQPLIILMAFAVLLLSLFVIILIFRKFEADLEEFRSRQAESGGATARRGGVISSAVWLGIANMRKRKLRTFLTAITIVLITFALLAFSSATTYQNKRDFAISSAPPPYAGVLIKKPAMAPFHPRALSYVTALAREYPVIPRYWVTSTDHDWALHARNLETGDQASLQGALGLSPLESGLAVPEEWLEGWERFREGNACFLSESQAQALNLSPGDRVGLGGRELILAGTFDPATVEGSLTMLDGQSLLPFDFSIQSDADSGSAQAAGSLDADSIEGEQDLPRIPPDSLIIIPDTVARELGGSLRSMALVTPDHATAAEQVQLLSNVLAFPLFYSTEEGTNVIAAAPLLPNIPRNLLTPLVLAALIIFNTMLNSVAERKQEIYIYTSLGLAPVHVGMLFLSEAVTYGLMGSVFGYVAGQGLATVLTHFGLMGGITLNYSGSSVILVMGLVIGVVVLSSLVPAIMAGKLASPSDEMKWTVPQPVDGKIRDQLPFTVHRDAAPGLISYIHSYMTAHEDGTIGHFSSADTRLLPSSGETVVGLEGTLWLAPYDLGVRQDLSIRIVPDAEEGEEVCKILIELTHVAGQINSWWKQNRSFLKDLRNQLLGWRKVPTERILQYIDEFEAKRVQESARS
ncbi:MAG: hypothetical protein JJU05_02815 [Verrucomicrobia bacterium]|nr:hypothetical protein [Verrucomicrobiota bacterium]MCH8527676.1 hypothetical protein [Kiritimatiellia bacterium]